MMNHLYDQAGVSVGEQYYWQIGSMHVHGQVLVTTWVVFGLILTVCVTTTTELSTSANEFKQQAGSKQNFIEYFVEFIRDIASTQIHSNPMEWVPFLGSLFVFIFVSNWAGSLIPWRIIELPNGELGAPTNDINTTTALSLLVSVSYFYAGLRKKGVSYFKRYIEPTPILLPVNILEDFTKPLSLSFRLFGNILADELVVAVLLSLVPLVVPIPLIFLGLFTSAIQALIFSTLAGAYVGEALE
jgi:F-type H+-transporting ATPase subunit a